MKKLNKTSTIYLLISISLTLFFPCGVVCVIFGATKNIISLLVVGIIFVICGFYGAPIMWVKFGALQSKKYILRMITNDNIYMASTIASQLGKRAKLVQDDIVYLIQKGYLTGYLFTDREHLVLNTNEKQMGDVKLKKKCPNCGGMMECGNFYNKCPYCDYSEKNS